MKKAIVTLVIGNRFSDNFRKWCFPGWREYAKRHDLDLLLIDKPIDMSARARGRSPAWQKCILHRDNEVRKYDQIAWVDADIRINPNSPNIFDDAPRDKVSAVDDYGSPNRQDHDMILSRQYADWEAAGIKYVKDLTPQEYHGLFGLKCLHDHVVQTGVMVFSPEISSHIFERVYNNYEDKGHPSWHYEMRPLSYEILEAGVAHWINHRYNVCWGQYEQLYYPFLDRKTSRLKRLTHKFFPFLSRGSLRSKCVDIAFVNSYFLHFAGSSQDYKLINPTLYCKSI